MAKQVHLSHSPQKQVFTHHFMLKYDFLMIVYLNNHYGFVQYALSTFNFDPHFFSFKIKYFFFRSKNGEQNGYSKGFFVISQILSSIHIKINVYSIIDSKVFGMTFVNFFFPIVE